MAVREDVDIPLRAAKAMEQAEGGDEMGSVVEAGFRTHLSAEGMASAYEAALRVPR